MPAVRAIPRPAPFRCSLGKQEPGSFAGTLGLLLNFMAGRGSDALREALRSESQALPVLAEVHPMYLGDVPVLPLRPGNAENAAPGGHGGRMGLPEASDIDATYTLLFIGGVFF